MNKTNIEWVRNPDGSQGYTENPMSGCLNHDNGLCKGGGFPCYAYKLAKQRLKPLYLANKNVVYPYVGSLTINPYADPFYPRFWEDRLHDRGLFQQKSRGIFPCDMGDLFGIGVPEAWTDRVMDNIRTHRQHRFYLLTKQPQNLPTSPSYFPDNAWVGVTATNDEAYQAATFHLEEVKATVKYINFEPLLRPIDCRQPWDKRMNRLIDWIIIGACTGTEKDMIKVCQAHPELTLCGAPRGKWTAQPPIEWLREIVEAADKAGVKVFLKDNFRPILSQEYDKYPPAWAFSQGGLRQELPE